MANTLRKLSGSTDGLDILVVATATLGTTIHTAVAGTTAGTLDRIWLEAYNEDTVARELTIEWGGAAAANLSRFTIPAKAGWIKIISGHVLQNTKVVTAFCAAAASKIIINGHVITNTD